MTNVNTSSRKAMIEALWARGRSTYQIVAETGVGLEYVQHVVRLIQSHSRMSGTLTPSNDDAKHLKLIAQKHGEYFPVCFLPARARMRA